MKINKHTSKKLNVLKTLKNSLLLHYAVSADTLPFIQVNMPREAQVFKT